MLIIISLSNEELNIRELNRKYNNVLNSKIIKNNSTLVSFDNLIKRMDNEFTVTYLEDADDILTIKFKILLIKILCMNI